MKYKTQIKKAIEHTENILNALNRIENEKQIDIQYYWQIAKINFEIVGLNRKIKKINKILKGIITHDLF